jgi:hypothetical protein
MDPCLSMQASRRYLLNKRHFLRLIFENKYFDFSYSQLKNSNITNILYEYYRNQRSSLRDTLVVSFINDMSISDMDSIRTQLGMLTMMSSQTNEITRQTQVCFSINFCYFKRIPKNNFPIKM